MNNTWLENLGRVGLIASLAVAGSRSAIAQIVPDSTLGNENSVVVPINTQLEHIQGGALRGSNLFHSFQEFNVKNGHSAYFVNPALVENIFSRVTGGNISEIFGTLGVLGEANLYLINPNGIIFGENASLDIQGSFVATTASRLVFGDGSEYSAVNPEIPAAIVNNVPIQISLQFEGEPAAIVNLANLSTGESLTLAGGNLDLEGELVAGKDLTLTAEDTVKIRDGESDRFVAAAGNDLLVQGNEGVDIFALNHAESGLFSGGDMILRSNNAVIGDAHYYSGGNFRIEELDGDLGELESPNDPIIRSLGDVSFNSYVGASLHILAAGSVKIPGFIFITSTDTNNAINPTATPELANVILSDGTTLEIDGSRYLTVDIRAGMKRDVVVGSGISGSSGTFLDAFFNSIVPTLTSSPTSADIAIGGIFTDLVGSGGGRVFLTNRYEPNISLEGAISADTIVTLDAFGGGSVTIDSQGDIEINSLLDVSSLDFVNNNYLGDGGNIKLLANSDINLNSDSSLRSRGNLGGTIILKTVDNIFVDGSIIESFSYNSQISKTSLTGGDIIIEGQSILFDNGVRLGVGSFGQINTGNISIRATNNIRFQGENSLGTGEIFNEIAPTGEGNGGSIDIKARTLEILDGVRISSSTSGTGNAGNITIDLTDLRLQGKDSSGRSSGIFSQVISIGKGDGGEIKITTEILKIFDGARISNSTFGEGNAGNITISATETIQFQGEDGFGRSSGITSQVASTAEGNGGEIEITTKILEIFDGARISNSTLGKGDAGNIIVNTTEILHLQGEDRFGVGSTIASGVSLLARGDGGEIKITTGTLELLDGTVISTNSFGKGNAGNIRINATEILRLQGERSFGRSSGIFSQIILGEGNGGEVNIMTKSLELLDGSFISTDTIGKGNAGNITINSTEILRLQGKNRFGVGSTISSGVAPIGEGNGGEIKITTENLDILDGAIIATTTLRGKGNAGSINISANRLNLTEGSEIQSDTGGNFDVDAGDINLSITDTINIQRSGIFASTRLNSTGNGGDIEITTPTLSLQDNATINVNSQGEGIGGDIEIRTNRIDLDNSQITAETRSTQGGNIELTVRDLLLMRHESKISTTAGTAQAGGDGGNITINAENGFIVGPPGEDNDITANAFEGNGGNINITAQEIFGLKFRDELTPRSDITASSEFGLDGTVQLNTLGIDPNNGLTNLPEDQNDPEVRQGCSQGGANSSSLNIPGRGGAPDNPDDMQIPESYDEFIPLDELETDGTIEENRENSDRISSEEERPPVLFSCQSN
ncbi:MAG: filamentous hemagglutinin N-terminal domain-containing protein [Cyanobacteria bacterium P01_E01_bin.42]